MSLNKVILQGRLTKEPELKATTSGVSVCSFTLAVDRDFGEKQSDFIDVVAWRNTAEFVSRYFNKGKQILIVGSLQVRKWQTGDGQNRYATEVIAESVYFCGDKQQNGTEQKNEPENNADIDGFMPINDADLPF